LVKVHSVNQRLVNLLSVNLPSANKLRHHKIKHKHHPTPLRALLSHRTLLVSPLVWLQDLVRWA
jgi:hypothetical protein